MKGVIYNNRTFGTIDNPYLPGIFAGRNDPGKSGTDQDYNRYNRIGVGYFVQFHLLFYLHGVKIILLRISRNSFTFEPGLFQHEQNTYHFVFLSVTIMPIIRLLEWAL